MDPAKWKTIKEVFSSVIELSEADRRNILAQKNPEIRIEVEKLIGKYYEAEGFIDKPILVERGLAFDEIKDNLLGGTVGNYRIVEKIGAGGMGKVYLAERLETDLKFKVALKMIKKGMDSDLILNRFVNERKILSTLRHPNIAQLLDGGISSEGAPYFVMEYVDGKPLKEYCYENGLGLEKRLEIFRSICSAVEHAHTNLVVHRDLKPSNVLVTREGIPKLLDFGIAKLLSDDPIDTRTATRTKMFTPEYASPEQIKGSNVSTSTDIYSLGVVLYELLTDHRPFSVKGQSYEAIVKNICETEPPRPSNTGENDSATDSSDKQPALVPLARLRGDVDNIVLKALRKDPAERYGSVREFSDDISRFLNGHPVLARPQTPLYRFGKYFKRHRVGVIAAALVLISLVGGVSVATWQAIVARQERARAEKRFEEVRKLANAVIFDYQDGVQKLPGATVIRNRMVNDGAEYLDSLAAENPDDLELLKELADAYDRLGDVKGSALAASLGDSRMAKEFYLKALNLRERIYSYDRSDMVYKELLARSFDKIADVEYGDGNQAPAVENYRKAADIREELQRREPTNKHVFFSLAKGYRNIAVRGRSNKNTDENLALCKKAIEMIETLLVEAPGNSDYQESHADFIQGIAAILESNPARRAESIPYYQQVIEMRRNQSNGSPDNLNLRQKYGMEHSYLGHVLYQEGNILKALEEYKKCLAILDPLVAEDPQNSQLLLDRAVVQNSLAFGLVNLSGSAETLNESKQLFSSLLDLYESRYAANNNDSGAYFRIGMAKEGLATAYEGLSMLAGKNTAEKLASLQKAVLLYQESQQIYIVFRDHENFLASLNVDVNDAINDTGKATARCKDKLRALETR